MGWRDSQGGARRPRETRAAAVPLRAGRRKEGARGGFPHALLALRPPPLRLPGRRSGHPVAGALAGRRFPLLSAGPEVGLNWRRGRSRARKGVQGARSAGFSCGVELLVLSGRGGQSWVGGLGAGGSWKREAGTAGELAW